MELLASYQDNRSQCLKDKREDHQIGLDDFFSEEEREGILHQRAISRYVSHCNFAIESINVQGEKIDEALLKILSSQDQKIVRMRIENRLGYSAIGHNLSLSTANTKIRYEKAIRKMTKHIRELQDSDSKQED
ncbi:hypothetical protein ASF12_23525 [Paenibacillus sp. Leaf72]|nr:hypothetical protein ASF12_23525 [Paenibacillus sp. Leaf72]